MTPKENNKFSELPDKFRKILEAEKVRDCILVSLRDELINRHEHLDNADIIDVVRDAIDVPVKFVESKYASQYWHTYLEEVKTSRTLEQIHLHSFTKKSLSKCGMYVPFPK